MSLSTIYEGDDDIDLLEFMQFRKNRDDTSAIWINSIILQTNTTFACSIEPKLITHKP